TRFDAARFQYVKDAQGEPILVLYCSGICLHAVGEEEKKILLGKTVDGAARAALPKPLPAGFTLDGDIKAIEDPVPALMKKISANATLDGTLIRSVWY